MATQISLLFLLYMIGMSWSLIAMIWFDLLSPSNEMVQNLILWPLLWVLGVAIVFSLTIDKILEMSMDMGDALYRRVKKH